MPSVPAASQRGWSLWERLSREQISEQAETNAIVVITVGAIEQHGPFLPTGTDILVARGVTERALDLAAARCPDPLLLVEFLRIGCSAHHLPFGGTISLRPQVMIDVLVDTLRSIERSGIKRVILVNGHGGNTGVCQAAASEVGATSALTVGVLDYWECAPAIPDVPVPGHAGRFETSLMLALHSDGVSADRERSQNSALAQPGRGIYGQDVWSGIDGYTDVPANATAEEGHRLLAATSLELGARLVGLAQEMA